MAMSLSPITVLAYNKKLRSRFSRTRGWMWWELLWDILFCAFKLAGSHRGGQQCWAQKREIKGTLFRFNVMASDAHIC